MKKMNFEQMENIRGGYTPNGWTWSLEQHILCIASGVLMGGGVAGRIGYAICIGLLLSSGYAVAIPDSPTNVNTTNVVASCIN
ncbi:MAG: hypothetical protein LBE13_09535 [Bacteroidales bacterium]|jgi:hypothetical protein|nr:hypothetical protein [Bacteroidales bacterium]